MAKKIGYRRVSSIDQNTTRQLEDIELDKCFEDKISGSSLHRPQLAACLEFLREGDTLIVHSIDRLARNLANLQHLVDKLTGQGVAVRFIKEGLIFSGDDSAMNRLMLQLLGGFAEFERSMIRERQREGIAAAQRAGKHLGRTKTLTDAQEGEICTRVANGEAKKTLAAAFGISRQTVYAILERIAKNPDSSPCQT